MDHLAEVEKLIANPELIDPGYMTQVDRLEAMIGDRGGLRREWMADRIAQAMPFSPFKHAGQLFIDCHGEIDGKTETGLPCCCLTQIRSGNAFFRDVLGWNPEITEAIESDLAIPTAPENIESRADIIRLVAWQQHLDNVIPNRNGVASNA